jgi:hypothetical protein
MIIHVIPVGNGEPIHKAGEDCFCRPFLDDEGVCCHHSLDGRETAERFTREKPADSQWVMVESD